KSALERNKLRQKRPNRYRSIKYSPSPSISTSPFWVAPRLNQLFARWQIVNYFEYPDPAVPVEEPCYNSKYWVPDCLICSMHSQGYNTLLKKPSLEPEFAHNFE